MKKNFLILFLSIFIFSFSQDKDQLSELNYSDIEKLIQDYYSRNEISKVNELSRYYLNKARRNQDIDKMAEGYIFVSFSEKFPDCLKYVDSIKMFSSQLSDQKLYPARLYLLKGNLYYQNDKQKEAFQNYLTALKYAKEKNNKKQIAYAETRIAYLNNYIGKHQEAAGILKRLLYNSDDLTDLQKKEVHLNLADIYLDLNKLDSAKVMIVNGLEAFSATPDSRFYNAYLSSYGHLMVKEKKYNYAIQTFNKCIDFFIKGNDKRDTNYAFMYLGEAHIGLGNKEKAIASFEKIDSLVKKDNYTFPELKNVYTYLIDYYKEKEDRKKQLYYIDRLLEVNGHLDSEFRYISRELPKQYDTAQLIEQKELIMKKLKKRKFTSFVSVILLSVLSVFSAFLYYNSKKKEKNYKQRAQELLKSLEELKSKKEIIQVEANKEIIIASPKKSEKLVPEEIYVSILKGLETFENEKQFLEKGISLNSLAKKLNTNTSYLSDVINTHKNKNIATYLSDLRVDYAIKALNDDKKLRSYKIVVIADELGYNNEQAFTKAFKNRTGTTVSAYIKELNSL